MTDIPLVFDNVAAPGSRAEGPTAQPMADRMSDAFIAFARTGDPNCRAIPKWEPYTLPRRQTHAEIEAMALKDGLADQMKVFGLWDAFTMGDRGRKP